MRTLRAAYRRQATCAGLGGRRDGTVTSIQRFAGALDLHVHFRTLVLDGDTRVFHPAPQAVVAAPHGGEDGDPLPAASRAAAGSARAAVLGRCCGVSARSATWAGSTTSSGPTSKAGWWIVLAAAEGREAASDAASLIS